MSMMNYKSYITKINPLWKIYILILTTIVATFDFMPFLSISLIFLGFIIIKAFSEINVSDMLKRLAPLLLISAGFVLVITATRYASNQNLNFVGVLAIGLRVIIIGLYSNIFVLTTNPIEFVMSLNRYFGMPLKWCYSFLSAYRFLPTFKEELEIIKFAHQVRGMDSGKNFIEKLLNSRRFIIPMMATAIRKGIRVSMAMETKGFGKYHTRTNFRDLYIKKKDVLIFVIFIAIVITIAIILTRYNLTKFNLVYKDL